MAKTMETPPTMKPQIVSFLIVGMSPLLQNNPAMFIGIEETNALGTKKTYKDDVEASMRVYKDEDGHFVHPSQSFVKCMTSAVSGKKFGKVHAVKTIKGSVFIAEPWSIILDANGKPATKYSIDKRAAVVGKARIPRCRPMFDKWSIKLALDIDTALVSPSSILDALMLGGRTIGVGDYRPEKGGGFGRFQCELVK
jgi:hypothetical protein